MEQITRDYELIPKEASAHCDDKTEEIERLRSLNAKYRKELTKATNKLAACNFFESMFKREIIQDLSYSLMLGITVMVL